MNANEPAYPNIGPELPWAQSPGLTKREYFAAMAMQGLLASCANRVSDPYTLAPDATACADAIIAALSKGAADAR